MSILFKLEKPLVEYLEGFILLPREGGELNFFLELLIGNSSSRNRKNFPIGSTKVGASMVGGMFVVAIMSC